MAGGVLVAGLILAAWGALAAFQARSVRCYVLEKPFTTAERVLSEGRHLDCGSRQCWLAVKFGANRGLACFYPRLLRSTSDAILNGFTPGTAPSPQWR